MEKFYFDLTEPIHPLYKGGIVFSEQTSSYQLAAINGNNQQQKNNQKLLKVINLFFQ
jgi:hypothetical protein